MRSDIIKGMYLLKKRKDKKKACAFITGWHYLREVIAAALLRDWGVGQHLERAALTNCVATVSIANVGTAASDG